MAEAINCNYSRTALRELCRNVPNDSGAVKQYTRSDIINNSTFAEQGSKMKLSPITAHTTVRKILTFFNKKWYPNGQKQIFLDVFSINSWTKLSTDEKNEHTIKYWVACHTEHASLTKSVPYKRKESVSIKKPVIAFNEDDLSSSSNFGAKALKVLNTMCQQHLQSSASEVLSETPRSKLVMKPSGQSGMRKIVRETKNTIQHSMDQNGLSTVLGNRLSWRKFNKNDALDDNHQTPKRKQTELTPDENTAPVTKRKHGTALNCAQDELLLKAQSWGENEVINWSALAREHGITSSNGGQSIKEFLKEHNIPAAFDEQRVERSQRRKRKTLPGGVPFPMPHSSAFQRKQLFAKVQSGVVIEGENVVPVSVPSVTVNKPDKEVVETETQVFAKKISLKDIRKKFLVKHEELGVIRTDQPGSHLTRYLKVWHDHSSIAGHGHFLVLVSVIYDTSFYLTQKEVSDFGVNIDIQSTIETPEIHILGRSSSSLDDQSLFSSTRNECK